MFVIGYISQGVVHQPFFLRDIHWLVDPGIFFFFFFATLHTLNTFRDFVNL